MEFWDWVLVGAIAGVVVAAVVGAARWMWLRRDRPVDWMATGEAKVEHRRRRIKAAEHHQLVTWVLQRAEVLGIEVPVGVAHLPGRVMVTYQPTGRTFAWYPDLPSYRTGAERSEHTGSNAHYGSRPKVVSEWPDEMLHGWLDKHASQLPSAT